MVRAPRQLDEPTGRDASVAVKNTVREVGDVEERDGNDRNRLFGMAACSDMRIVVGSVVNTGGRGIQVEYTVDVDGTIPSFYQAGANSFGALKAELAKLSNQESVEVDKNLMKAWGNGDVDRDDNLLPTIRSSLGAPTCNYTSRVRLVAVTTSQIVAQAYPIQRTG